MVLAFRIPTHRKVRKLSAAREVSCRYSTRAVGSAPSLASVLCTASNRARDVAHIDQLLLFTNGGLLTRLYALLLLSGGASGNHGHSKGKGKSALSSKKDTDTLNLRFCYLPQLGIVAVCSPAGWSSSFLTNLFPNDTGRETPNPANHHGPAARASVHGVFKFPADVPCRPYRWVQGLAGLHFPPAGGVGMASVGAEGAKPAALEPSTRAVVAALRSRAQTHLQLSSQLKTIAESGPVSLPTFDDKLMRTNGNVELRRYWKRGTEGRTGTGVMFGGSDTPPCRTWWGMS